MSAERFSHKLKLHGVSHTCCQCRLWHMLSSTVSLERLSEKGRTFGWHQQIPQQVYVMYMEGMYKGQDTVGIYTERNKTHLIL